MGVVISRTGRRVVVLLLRLRSHPTRRRLCVPYARHCPVVAEWQVLVARWLAGDGRHDAGYADRAYFRSRGRTRRRQGRRRRRTGYTTARSTTRCKINRDEIVLAYAQIYRHP